jgi:hypothetical protein
MYGRRIGMERGCITAAMEAMNTTRVVTEKPVVIERVEGTTGSSLEARAI